VSKTPRNKKAQPTSNDVPASTEISGETANNASAPLEKPIIKQAYILVKTGTAYKIGKRSLGTVSYRLLSDMERQNLNINITSNEGGGYFSREILPLAKVKDCLTSAAKDKPFSSKLFKDAFVGRSANNAGFLTAILYGEGVLIRAPNTQSLYVLGEDWDSWTSTMLELEGERIEIEVPSIKKTDDNQASEKPMGSEHEDTA
jgi:hypothetical protein